MNSRAPSARVLRLRGVYTGPAVSKDGFRVISLECYDDGIVVRWASRRPSSALAAPTGDQLELSDDIGTDYFFHGGGSSSSEGSDEVCQSGAITFYPTAP